MAKTGKSFQRLVIAPLVPTCIRRGLEALRQSIGAVYMSNPECVPRLVLFCLLAGFLTLLWLVGLCMHTLVNGVHVSEYQMAPAAAPSVRSATMAVISFTSVLCLQKATPFILFLTPHLISSYFHHSAARETDTQRFCVPTPRSLCPSP
jgi:hypothetical protein